MGEIPPGWVTFRYAAVLDRFHLTPAALAAMTDYQLDALCGHRRTAEGVLVAPAVPAPPPAAAAPADRLLLIDRLEHDRLITPARAADLREQVRREP